MPARKVLIEASERLARMLGDLLDRERFWIRFDEKFPCSVEEPLHPARGAVPGRAQRPHHGSLPSAGLCLLGRHRYRAGSMTTSRVDAPLSGTRGWCHASTGNETLISE